ncbi:hypothetical protein SCHPADRAFT_910774 [Schizopora paradoxa]|uniref:Uncharacterized protein n=1 Tax=Schizopora paradoxa TaxID=27342 RepID=A0A0H2R227_9AGAM|nr:hypothetical protein SCHPADRAFT_910774 [Schizopora paradoxa]
MAEELQATHRGMSGSPALVPYHQRLRLTAAGEDRDDFHTPNLTRGVQQYEGTIVDVQFASARNIASKLLATQEGLCRRIDANLTLSKYWRTSTRVSKQQRKGAYHSTCVRRVKTTTAWIISNNGEELRQKYQPSRF